MGLLLLLHIGAMLLIFTLPLVWWAHLLIAIVLLSSLVYYIEKHIYYKLAKAIKSLIYANNKTWQLVQRNGQIINGTLQNDSVVTRYLLILNFKTSPKNKIQLKRSVIVFNDAMSTVAFKELRLLCLKQ